MRENTKVIQHATREAMHKHFRALDIFSADERELSTAYAGSFDADVSFRMDEHASPFSPEEIEANFKAMARGYGATSEPLVQWVKQGNRLPECYR